MSHLTERKDKVCLNCQASIHGRFCHICGQENIEPKESFWHLVTHFVYDITHFDGKFFNTLTYLLFKPGYLSHEYLKGRRADYLHPIRMYVFTSAVFFLIFFSMNKDEELVRLNETQPTADSLLKKLQANRADFVEDLNDSSTGIPAGTLHKLIASTDSDIALIRRDTTAKNKIKTLGNSFTFFEDSTKTYTNVAGYDSIQARLPASKRDNFVERRFRQQNIHLNEKYKNDGKAIWSAILNKFKHLFPQMLFVSLPLFALVLQLLYSRKKDFFYVNQVVYTIHLYCATFILILMGMGIDYVATKLGYRGEWIGSLFTIFAFFYWYKALRNFYEQRRAKTILKFVLVMFLSLIIMIILFAIFFIFSAMSI